MRVLVADQEPEMLEAVARAFEVDVATTKATCVDLLRANHFDVIVACERLGDGSGLELLSHVGQRWPNVIRILAIEPERRAMLRGRLGPFKLFETIPYPIDEDKLEAALTRAAEAIAENEAAAPTAEPVPRTQAVRNQVAKEQIAKAPAAPPPSWPAPTAAKPNKPVQSAPSRAAPGPTAPVYSGSSAGGNSRNAPSSNAPAQSGAGRSASAPSGSSQPSARTGLLSSGTFQPGAARTAPPGSAQSGAARNAPTGTPPKDDPRRAGARTDDTSSALGSRNVPPASRIANASPSGVTRPGSQGLAPTGRKPGNPVLDYPPLPTRGSKIVPLGSPTGPEYKIVNQDYREQSMPGTPRAERGPQKKEPTLQEKASSLAAGAKAAMSAAVRYLTPQSSDDDADDDNPLKTPPRKKR